MNNNEDRPRSLQIYFSVNALALITAGITMMLIARGMHLSAFRLLVIGGAFLLGAISGRLAVMVQIQPERRTVIQKAIFNPRLTKRWTIVFSVLFAIFWCLTWFPIEKMGRFSDYFTGIYPLILFGTLNTGMSLVFLFMEGDGHPHIAWKGFWQEQKAVLKVALMGLIGFCLVAFLIVRFGVLQNPEPFWYGAGIPLLAWQVFVALLIAILAITVETRFLHSSQGKSFIFFILIWAVAAFFWSRQPLSQSFWITPRLPPNFENYPFSDLMVFDLGSQFALIGQGINNHIFFDRALYMSFLVYLHGIGGQNYQHLMAIQAAIFAVFPAILYLIGEKLHSRIAGIILAVLTILRGSNSLIATTWIYTATFKHMLTDFPTALGLAIFILLILHWLEDPRQRWQHACWAAGVVGLTSLVRPHVVLLLPALCLAVLWAYKPRWKPGLAVVGLTLVAFLASVSPWVIFGPANGSILTLYRVRIEDVIRQRYVPGTFNPTHAQPAAGSKLELPIPLARQNALKSKNTTPFQVSHFLHNLVTSSLIFPESPEFLNVESTVRGSNNFWSARWDGAMTSAASGMLILNLAVVSLGFGAAYKRGRWRGFVPLTVFLIYDVANALARTSGGRYIVPIDWILLVYFGLGMAEILQMGRLYLGNTGLNNPSIPQANKDNQMKRIWMPNAVVVILALTLIGGTIPLAGNLYPVRYPEKKQSVLLDEITPYFPSLDLKRGDVESFLLQPQAALFEGRVLYPSYYLQNLGEPNPLAPFKNFSYSRLEFLMIGPHGLDFVILPGEQPKTFPNASDAILLGCKNITDGTYNAASALVVVLPQQAVSYARSPAALLNCPIPEPVCDNNKICH